ncbi:MAG: histidine kinase [Geobacteraceae bacterium GWC2_48_7]|nr:MAG: histidine kinase [Geobacteraceae bacterium GWC2_48_7]
MDGYKKLQEILSSALQQAGEESGMLLGQELSISLLDSIKTTKTTFFGDLDDSCFVIGVDSREAYPGQFYLIFSLRDAIVLSSTLLGIPPARVKEKQRLSILENDDIDAFSEIGNMINGSFNTVFQGSLPNKVHLKVLVPKKFIPDIDQINEEEPLPDGEYLMFRSKLEMAGQELNHLDILIPVNLGSAFDPPAEKAEIEEPPDEATETEADESGEVIPAEETENASASASAVASDVRLVDSLIILEDDEAERKRLIAAVGFTGYEILGGDLNADIKELFTGRDVRLVLICSKDADERELAVCIKINAIRQDAPPPIIMSAQRWTKTAVLKALKFGARDIIIAPCSDTELAAKIKRSCRFVA